MTRYGLGFLVCFLAAGLGAQTTAINVPGQANWIGNSHHFWYHKTVEGGTQFVLVDADSGVKKPAFDHARLAEALSAVAGKPYTALTLPFIEPPARGGRGGTGAGGLTFTNDERGIAFALAGFAFTCDLDAYTCQKGAELTPGTGGFGRGGVLDPADEPPFDPEIDAPPMDDVEVQDGIQSLRNAPARNERMARTSPDGKWDAIIENYNIFLEPHGGGEAHDGGGAQALSTDGSEGNYYSLRSLAWSPDSTRLVAYKTRPGYDRRIHYVESSPADQIQPKVSEGPRYNKPGDVLDVARPALFTVATRAEIEIDPTLFPNAFSITPPVWWKDGRGFTFEYNQRGHQVYRVIEVNGTTGAARALIEETSPTFIDYR
ncbi:MAG TPA: DPP IV N-terminal domain-containing protein, partial [Terriglobales bacterium]